MPEAKCSDTRSRWAGCGLSLLVLASAGGIASAAFADTAAPSRMAVANFDFVDTSGEVKDQTAAHEARLKMFGATLRDGLSGNQKLEIVPLACQANPCTATDPGLASLAAQAKQANARYLVVGGFHKMSTLVGWLNLVVVDLDSNKATCDRRMTYRGDTDEAWRRAAEFAVEDLETHCIPQVSGGKS